MGIYDESASAYRLNITSAGNVGIGTTTPTALLTLSTPGNTVDGTYYSTVTIRKTVMATYSGIRFDNNSTALYRMGTDPSNNFQIARFQGTGAPDDGGFYMNQNGSVGIGTTTPSASYRLDVNGGINASGNINSTGNITASGSIGAKYQDIAEWVESSQLLPAGTVVILDQTKSNQVVASTEAYDTRVAGVISEQPGIALGESGKGKVLVATTGRVRIKVDASRGAIKIGDLLVTSDVPGVAMKSEPLLIGGRQMHAPGTLIGKALEPLEKGISEIRVLLSLQ